MRHQFGDQVRISERRPSLSCRDPAFARFTPVFGLRITEFNFLSDPSRCVPLHATAPTHIAHSRLQGMEERASPSSVRGRKRSRPTSSRWCASARRKSMRVGSRPRSFRTSSSQAAVDAQSGISPERICRPNGGALPQSGGKSQRIHNRTRRSCRPKTVSNPRTSFSG